MNTDPSGLAVCFGFCTVVPAVIIGQAIIDTAAVGIGLCALGVICDSPVIDPNVYNYDDEGHRIENELLDGAPAAYGFFGGNDNCGENRRNLATLRKRLARQEANKVAGNARGAIGNQQSAHSHAIRVKRLTDKIKEYEKAVANCPPEQCE